MSQLNYNQLNIDETTFTCEAYGLMTNEICLGLKMLRCKFKLSITELMGDTIILSLECPIAAVNQILQTIRQAIKYIDMFKLPDGFVKPQVGITAWPLVDSYFYQDGKEVQTPVWNVMSSPDHE